MKRRKKQRLNSSLKARLQAVLAAFGDERFVNSRNNYSKPPEDSTAEPRKPAQTKHWREALQEEDEGDGGGGRGTIKGLRGKDTVQAMRKLGRR